MRLTPLLAFGAAVILGGCAVSPSLPVSPPISLNVPFVPPENELCAATALSSVSRYWEKNASFASQLNRSDLERLTLIPEKKGTLQDELSAVSRQNGFVVYPLPGTLNALMRELQNGHPVILLVNRSIAVYPLWHYTVITGYDPEHQSFLTHFSQTPNEPISAYTLDAMWERSGRWGIVPLPPSLISDTATARTALKAIWELERTDPLSAIIAYDAALKRWPDDSGLLFAMASAHQSRGDAVKAEALYRQLLAHDAGYLPAINNLAWILYHKGEKESAKEWLKQHSEDQGDGSELIRASYHEMQ